MGKHRKPPFRRARVCDCGDHGFVGLTRGLVALLDPGDVPLIRGGNWSVIKGPYARTPREGGGNLMHRVIMAPRAGLVVDHRNHDTLDNRRANMRVCTPTQNRHNSRATKKTSHFKGVHRTQGGRWGARICVQGVRHNLGDFGSEIEAALAYRAAAEIHHGRFACVKTS